MVALDKNASYEVRKEMSRPAPLQSRMSVLLWNARGVSRKWFKRNIKQLLKDHTPDIVVITETRVSKSNAEELVESLPYNSFETVEPMGFTGGIIILWNKGINTFNIVSKDLRALHGVVHVNNKPPFFFFLLFMLVASSKVD